MQVLFRAKEKNSNNYVIGYEYYNHIEDKYYITHYVSGSNCKIDRTTRSINIEGMLDSQGNKIYASLQEDGKGGDIFILGDIRLKYIAMIEKNQLMAKQQGTYGSFIGQGYAAVDKWKLIGIQE